LSLDEIEAAEAAIIKYVQHEAFPQEIKCLQLDKKEAGTKNLCSPCKINSNSTILNLDSVLIDGLLRVGGRLHNASISEEVKHQFILPRNHHVTEMILRHIHSQCHHQGKNHLIAELRQKYWVNKAGVAVKSLIKRCIVCQKQRAKVVTQKMSDLPRSRVKCDEPPFSYVGVDYFGPFEVKEGRSLKKRYGVLFTCMSSRAVHIEIANSMDTSSCINAVRRFLSRRGPVKEITSDYGTNLVGANSEMKRALEELNQEDLQRFSTGRGIKWSFNPPGASHHGGIWERQIRTVRKLLQAVVGWFLFLLPE
jgi:transposase InsO family protein